VLEGERSERLAEVNARIASRRAAAATEVEQARAAAQGDVEAAVRAVAARAGELATGRAPDPEVVQRAVADAMGAGVSR
jgi:F-type H+-transporting ATPase subunit b